jgi:hypothetical protein
LDSHLIINIFQPPVFSDLPKKVMISETKTGALTTFSVTDPSYGPDTIVCAINRTIPASESWKFYIVGKCITIYQYFSALPVLHYLQAVHFIKI